MDTKIRRSSRNFHRCLLYCLYGLNMLRTLPHIYERYCSVRNVEFRPNEISLPRVTLPSGYLTTSYSGIVTKGQKIGEAISMLTYGT